MYKIKVINRIAGKYQRIVSSKTYRRTVKVTTTIPLISFSFDDAPQTAFDNGGGILKANGARATYFVSLGLLGADSPSGFIASETTLRRALEDGHELGCHTFDHKDPWKSAPDEFERSVLKNRQELAQILPKSVFTSFAYPLCGPRPATKRRLGKLFKCCRGGGQDINVGTADLNLLNAFFLDKRKRDTIDSLKQLIDRNAESLGWLIFATHDIVENPSIYGCPIRFFEEVVEYSIKSGASILTVGKAFEQIIAAGNK